MIATSTFTLSFAFALSHFSATIDALPLADVSSDTMITTNICRIAGVYYEDSFDALAQFDRGELSVDDTYSPSSFRPLLQSCCDLRTPVARLSASGVTAFASSVIDSYIADPTITPAPLDDLGAFATALSSSSILPDLDTPASVSAHVAVSMASMSGSTLLPTIDGFRLSSLPYLPKIDMPVIPSPVSPSSVYISASQGVSMEYSVPSPSSTLGLSDVSLQDIDVNSLTIKAPVHSAGRPVIHGVAAGLDDLAEDNSENNGDDSVIVIDSLTISSAPTGSSSAASSASPTMSLAPHSFTAQTGSSSSTGPETETTELPSSASETSSTEETSSAAPTDSSEPSTSSPTATPESTSATSSDTSSSAAATAESMSLVSQPSPSGPADMSSSSTSAFTSRTSTSISFSTSTASVTSESTSPVSQSLSAGLTDTSSSTSVSTSTVGPASSNSDAASATAPTSTDCDCAIEEAVGV